MSLTKRISPLRGSHREQSNSVLIKSEAAKKFSLIKQKGSGEIANKNQVLNEIKEHERDHEFLKLEKIMQDGKHKKAYKFDHKRIKDLQDKELRAQQRANQYQQAELKKDLAMQEKLRIIDYWNYKQRFKDIKGKIKEQQREGGERNKFFNSLSIRQYIETAFEPKEPPLDKRFYNNIKKLIAIKLPNLCDVPQAKEDQPEKDSTVNYPYVKQKNLFKSQDNYSQHDHNSVSRGSFASSQQSHRVKEGEGFPIKFNVGKVLFTSRASPINQKDDSYGLRGATLDNRLDKRSHADSEIKQHVDFIPHSLKISPKQNSPYTKKDLNESLMQMNYGRIFAAQSTLSNFTSKFATLPDQGSIVSQQVAQENEKHLKANVIKDVLNYLDYINYKCKISIVDQDLEKLFKGNDLRLHRRHQTP